MQKTIHRILAMSVLLVPLGLGACASQSDMDQLRSEVSKAQAEAAAAKAEAAAAKAEAAAANARADEETKKASRMYNRSLRK
jgi:Tfp pilus assembly protein FimV